MQRRLSMQVESRCAASSAPRQMLVNEEVLPLITAEDHGCSIPTEGANAVRYAVDLAKKNSEALSFIPTPRLEQYHAAGQLLLATENDEPCGFLVYGRGWPVLKVYQACIQYDARRRQAGRDLVQRLRAIAERQHQDISLWCADDLDANDFWRAAGFTLFGQREGGKRRGRMHNGWFMPVAAPSLWTPATAFSSDRAPAVLASARGNP